MPRPLLCFIFLIAAISSSPAQQVDYRVYPQDKIIDRLRMAASKNEDRQSTLKKLFAEEACAGDRLVDEPVKHEKLGNVVCTLPGQSDDVILVTAHYDKVKPGMGVTDNWSGASMLPSLLYGISATPRKHTFVFIGFTGEEDGMVGSAYYAAHLTQEQRAKIKAVINMDTLGLGPTEIWTSHSDPELVKDMIQVASALHISLTGMNVEQVGSTDSESFAKYKIPRMTIHSLTEQTLGILHTERDQVSVIKEGDYYGSYRLITVFLAYLDGKLPTAAAATCPASTTSCCRSARWSTPVRIACRRWCAPTLRH